MRIIWIEIILKWDRTPSWINHQSDIEVRNMAQLDWCEFSSCDCGNTMTSVEEYAPFAQTDSVDF